MDKVTAPDVGKPLVASEAQVYAKGMDPDGVAVGVGVPVGVFVGVLVTTGVAVAAKGVSVYVF